MIYYNFKSPMACAYRDWQSYKTSMKTSLNPRVWQAMVARAYVRYLCLAAQCIVEGKV